VQVIRRLEAATEEQLLPKDDPELCFVTRLLQLAVNGGHTLLPAPR
jgi:hypothetical protein